MGISYNVSSDIWYKVTWQVEKNMTRRYPRMFLNSSMCWTLLLWKSSCKYYPKDIDFILWKELCYSMIYSSCKRPYDD